MAGRTDSFDLHSNDGLLVITGATGWVGRTALQELYSFLPPTYVSDRVRLFASRSASLEVNGFSHSVYPLHALPALASSEPLAGVFHTAFLTRDRLKSVGLDQYVATNRWITGQVLKALSSAPFARAVVISSGAAGTTSSMPLMNCHQLSEDPYGMLKREEEVTISAIVPSLVLRIYALSGYFIRDPHLFALGDFLISALRRTSIRIQSTTSVSRAYGNAGDIAALAWRWLLMASPPPPEPVPAVSLTTDLLSLAQRITDLYGLPPLQASIDPKAPPHRYVAEPATFLTALASHGLVARSLDQQILDTAAGLTHLIDSSLV